ncbi:hypothetical protein A2U01_0035399, partial [Trifolium medium]|nr:hypothetical protein [Trifolium medium]
AVMVGESSGAVKVGERLVRRRCSDRRLKRTATFLVID